MTPPPTPRDMAAAIATRPSIYVSTSPGGIKRRLYDNPRIDRALAAAAQKERTEK